MTRSEFLTKLSEVKDIFEWEIDKTYYLRGWNNGFDFCPITAVNYAEHLIYTPVEEVSLAVERLKLDKDEAKEIVDAADARSTWSHEVSYNIALREEMLKILGFE